MTLGLCGQVDLDREVENAARESGAPPTPAFVPSQPDALLPVDESLEQEYEPRNRNEKFDPDTVFAGLTAWKKGKERPADE